MKLGISSQELQDFVLTRLELMTNMGSSESAGKANPKLGGETPMRTNLCEKTNLVPFFFTMYFFHCDF
jgi:hypothetical protein